MARFLILLLGYFGLRSFLKNWEPSWKRAPSEEPKGEDPQIRPGGNPSVFHLSNLAKIATIIAALVTAGSVIVAIAQNKIVSDQSNLLEEQARQADRQNFLLAFDHMSSLREYLFQEPVDSLGNRVADYRRNPQKVEWWPKPDLPTVELVREFARRESTIVTEALRPLLFDDAVSVSSSALLVLHALYDSLDAREITLIKANLSETDLKGVRLNEADLRRANLTQANLTGTVLFEAELGEADLYRAELDSANLSRAFLYSAILDRATLRRADLSEANLRRTSFQSADLNDADLTEADLSGTDLSKADLSRANLQSVKNWKRVESYASANITDIRNAPPSFRNYARSRGAIEVPSESLNVLRNLNSPPPPPRMSPPLPPQRPPPGIRDTIEGPAPDRSFAEVLQRQDLSWFYQAMRRTGLLSSIEQGGSYTVFAPTDEALARLPERLRSRFVGPNGQVRQDSELHVLLQNHIVEGRMKMATASYRREAVTTLGDTLDIQPQGYRLRIANASVQKGDIATSNGVVHIIDRALVPRNLSVLRQHRPQSMQPPPPPPPPAPPSGQQSPSEENQKALPDTSGSNERIY